MEIPSEPVNSSSFEINQFILRYSAYLFLKKFSLPNTVPFLYQGGRLSSIVVQIPFEPGKIRFPPTKAADVRAIAFSHRKQFAVKTFL
jgi:hypothetical protein